MEDLIQEFENLSIFYLKVLKENSHSINIELTQNEDKWNDWLPSRKKKKSDNTSNIYQDLLTIDSIKRDVQNNFDEGQKTIEDLMFQLEKPQEFIIEAGELYQVN